MHEKLKYLRIESVKKEEKQGMAWTVQTDNVDVYPNLLTYLQERHCYHSLMLRAQSFIR